MQIAALVAAMFLSTGSDCSQPVSAISVFQGGAKINVTASVCMTNPDTVCGVTYNLESINGPWLINSRTAVPAGVDITNLYSFPTTNLAQQDLGFTAIPALPASTNRVLATYKMSLSNEISGTTYSFKLGANSMLSFNTSDGLCGAVSTEFKEYPATGIFPQPIVKGIKQ